GQGGERDEDRGGEADRAELARDANRRGFRSRRRGDRRERLEVERHVASGLESLRRLLLEAVRDDSVDRRRNAAIRRRELRRLLRQDRDHRVGGGGLGEGALSRKHLVEYGPEGEDVRAGVHLLPADLLG